MTACSYFRLLVVVVALSLLPAMIQGGLPLSFPNFISKPTKHITESEKDLCDYIQRVLCARLELVLNNQRAFAFSKIYTKGLDKIDAEFTVSSFHGRSANNNNNNNNNNKEEKKMRTQNHHHSASDSNSTHTQIFPADVTSLKLVFPSHLQSSSQGALYSISTTKRHADTASLNQNTPPSLLQLCIRAMVLAFHFTPILSTSPLAYCSSWFRNQFWYTIITHSLSQCGPAFIKWGQWASTRPDMFPDGLCMALSNLHSNAPAHSWKVTQETVEQALSIPKGQLLAVFSSFDVQPIASGSIAQVHRATLWPTQEAVDASSPQLQQKQQGGEHNLPILVAVKVRHPHVEVLIDMDFRIMSFLARMIDAIPSLSWIQLRPSIEQFSHTMAAQAHLNVEAHHLEVLNHNFQSWDTVGFPKPLFASSSIIVETFERGSTCSAILDYYDHVAALIQSQQQGRNIHQSHSSSVDGDDDDETNQQGLGYTIIPIPLAKFIVTTGVSIYLKMLLVDNLMHADLHPGNLMLDTFFCSDVHDEQSTISWKRPKEITPNSLVLLGERQPRQSALRSSASMGKLPTKSGEFYGHVTLVDAGMVAQLDEVESRNFVGLLVSIGEGDGRAAAEVVLGFTSSPYVGESAERELFIQDMVAFFATSCKGYDTNVDFGRVLRGILGILKKHHVRIDANYATLVVNLMCVDSLARRVCPSYNCLDASKPLLRCYKLLCQDRDGRLSLRKNKWRQNLLKLMIPMMQATKNLSDDHFFRSLSHARMRNEMLLLK